jgi:hypothetical protein
MEITKGTNTFNINLQMVVVIVEINSLGTKKDFVKTMEGYIN